MLMDNSVYRNVDYWALFFSIISLVLFNLALFIPQQRIVISGFFIISLIFAFILFYIKKINSNELLLNSIGADIDKFKKEFYDTINYLKDVADIKYRLRMLENKKGQVDVIIKVIVAVVLIYVIFEVIKSLS